MTWSLSLSSKARLREELVTWCTSHNAQQAYHEALAGAAAGGEGGHNAHVPPKVNRGEEKYLLNPCQVWLLPPPILDPPLCVSDWFYYTCACKGIIYNYDDKFHNGDNDDDENGYNFRHHNYNYVWNDDNDDDHNDNDKICHDEIHEYDENIYNKKNHDADNHENKGVNDDDISAKLTIS